MRVGHLIYSSSIRRMWDLPWLLYRQFLNVSTRFIGRRMLNLIKGKAERCATIWKVRDTIFVFLHAADRAAAIQAILYIKLSL